jgi:protein-S-isoprenylcysteine O-methyltransferase Ste14
MDMVYRSYEEKGRVDLFKLIIMFIVLIVVAILMLIIIHPYSSIFIFDPFFWAFIGMFSLIGSSVTLCCSNLKGYPILNIFFVGLFATSRFILVLPSLSQPRFELMGYNTVFGLFIFILGLIFFIPLIQIKPFPSSDDTILLLTSGFYSFTRNPIYLGEILWTLGWSILHCSVIGVALVPIWWLGLLLIIVIEEDELERKVGSNFLDYKKVVTGRIIPGLPI